MAYGDKRPKSTQKEIWCIFKVNWFKVLLTSSIAYFYDDDTMIYVVQRANGNTFSRCRQNDYNKHLDFVSYSC